MKFALKTDTRELLTDTMTPVNMYLKIRDVFPESVLLESSDYGANDNSVAYLCFNPIASFKVHNGIMTQTFPNGARQETPLTNEISVVDALESFISCFDLYAKFDLFLMNKLINVLPIKNLVIGINPMNPIASVKKPGINSRIPEISITKPSNKLRTGNS